MTLIEVSFYFSDALSDSIVQIVLCTFGPIRGVQTAENFTRPLFLDNYVRFSNPGMLTRVCQLVAAITQVVGVFTGQIRRLDRQINHQTH